MKKENQELVIILPENMENIRHSCKYPWLIFVV